MGKGGGGCRGEMYVKLTGYCIYRLFQNDFFHFHSACKSVENPLRSCIKPGLTESESLK